MDVWTSLTQGEQGATWLVSSVVFVLYALVALPVFYAYKQRKFRKQISNHIVTSGYKLPVELTPNELSYLFSPSIKRRHIVASVMQLINDGLLLGEKEQGRFLLSIGPRVDSKVSLSNGYILDSIDTHGPQKPIDDIFEGNTSYRVPNTSEKVDGTRLYVFWWLTREGLRQRNVIVQKPARSYFKVVLLSLVRSFLLTFFITLSLQLFLMTIEGGIDIGVMLRSSANVVLWVILLSPALFLISFISVRLRGKFLGRGWILTEKKKRLLNQFDAFREYVRLVQEDAVLFDSDDAKLHAKIKTMPYAVALGYVEPPSYYTQPK